MKETVIQMLGNSTIPTSEIILTLMISVIASFYIYFVYKNMAKTAFYSKDSNVALAGILLVVSGIMIAMRSSLIVSLGMVGALSIVRFRTAIKSPLDLFYYFWSISEGIMIGVGMFLLAFLCAAIITIVVFVLDKLPNHASPALLVIRGKKEIYNDRILDKIIKENSIKYKNKSTILKNDFYEQIFEITLNNKTDLVNELFKVEGILDVKLIEHDGELRV